MTPKERVLACLHGEELYPIPSDVFENGVHPELRAKLLRHFGLAENDNEGLLQALDAHLRWCRPLYIGPPLEEDTSGRHAPIYPALKIVKDIWGTWGEGAATYYDGLPRPLRHAETVAEVEKHPWPNPEWNTTGALPVRAADTMKSWLGEMTLPVNKVCSSGPSCGESGACRSGSVCSTLLTRTA